MGSSVNRGTGVRAARALANRQRMVQTAYTLFCARGYAATPLSDIAAQAGVAVQTLYFTFGTKSALLHEAFAHAVMGPQPRPPELQPWYQKMLHTPDVRDGIKHVVAGSVPIFARVAPLINAVQAAASDPEAAAIRQQQEQTRRRSFTHIVEVLADKQRLRNGLNVHHATDIMMVIVSAEIFQTFTAQHGWSRARYIDWATKTVHHDLFQP